MIFLGGDFYKTWIIFTVTKGTNEAHIVVANAHNIFGVRYNTALATWIIVAGESTENKLNVKVGFDLTQGADGVPFLRIRDFEGAHEEKQQGQDDQTKEQKEKTPGVRADSDNDSEKDSSSESKESRGRGDQGEYEDYGSRLKSTKGLKPSEFEPEEPGDGDVRYDNSESEENTKSGSK